MTPAVFNTAPATGEYTITSCNQAAIVGTSIAFGVMWVDKPTAPYSLNFGLVTAPRTPPSSSYFDYMLTIVMENQGINNTYGNHCNGNCTYITQLAKTYGLAQNYSAVGHPSLENYLALTSAETIPLLPSPPTVILRATAASPQRQTLWIVLIALVELGRLTWKTTLAGVAPSLTHQANTSTVTTRLSIMLTSMAMRRDVAG